MWYGFWSYRVWCKVNKSYFYCRAFIYFCLLWYLFHLQLLIVPHTVYFMTERLYRLSPRSILSNVLVNIPTNWLTFHTLCILCKKILSLIWILSRLARLSNNFYVLNFGTLILYGQKTFDIFLYEHYHSLLYQVSVFPYPDCLSIIHSALVVVPLVWGDIVSAQGIIAYISLLQ